jgi:hypothetical protein
MAAPLEHGQRMAGRNPNKLYPSIFNPQNSHFDPDHIPHSMLGRGNPQ